MVNSLKQFTNSTEILIPLAQNAQEAVDCPFINDLYRFVSHDVICTQIPITLGWIFWSIVLYIGLGMIVYTLRGALFPSIVPENKELDNVEVWDLNENEMAYVNNEGEVIIPLRAGVADEHDEESTARHKYNSQAGDEDRALMMLELENTFSNSTDKSSPKYYATI